MEKYLFQSDRLGFRNWLSEDIPIMTGISADPEVMQYFPAPATPEQTAAFLARMQTMCEEKGYCYFAVDELETGAMIGFIGFCDQDFDAEFTPCVDIGWRLAKAKWGKGFATEGAKRCLQYGFENLGLKTIYSTAPRVNRPSIHVMEKIGMQKFMDFKHPRLVGIERLKDCLCYKLSV